MSDWKPIEEMPNYWKKGFMRAYSFKPENDGRIKLNRHYGFDRHFGSRVCDFYMDIPIIIEEPNP